VTKLGIKY